MNLRSLFLALLVLGAGLRSARAQPAGQGPLQGVVWQPPEEVEQAETELHAMRRAGAEAVRTLQPIHRERLLTLADTLGFVLFQDLPAAHLSAGALRDTLGSLMQTLEQTLRRARGHPSAQYFGLARLSDTSDPAACAALARLAQRVAAAGRRSYYLTPFIEAEACADASEVDLVLLDALGAATPGLLLERWRAARGDTLQPAVGVGALGVWVDPQADGLRMPHSPEAQARYLEEHLPPLLTSTRPRAVFIYRWRDLAIPSAAGRSMLSGRRYGLHAAGAPRPAFEVVRGLFTGRQHVFAFSAGETPPPEAPWLILMGWGVAALLGVSYAGRPHFRRTVERYIWAHAFYRAAVREGHGGPAGVLLLGSVALGAGLLTAAAVETARTVPSFFLMLHQLPPGVGRQLAALATQPWLLALVSAAFYTAGLMLWTLLLALASRQQTPLHPGQTLLLVAYPHWPMLALMAGAVVASTYPPAVAVPLLVGLLALALLTVIAATVRTLRDYIALTHPPLYATLVLAVASPLSMTVLLITIWALGHMDQVMFLWHLAVRA